ncbi:MAG: peptidoglycan-binding protein, partial [Nitrospira sp.]|nr:peptidoglycan-binding protein [Nitrospira sp.]
MKLQGRNLELHLRGDDVALLQSELRQLGIPIADPTGIFGSTTLLAVQRFQTEHRLPVTGIVDARTARLINQAIAALGRERWRVAGRVLQPDGSPVIG